MPSQACRVLEWRAIDPRVPAYTRGSQTHLGLRPRVSRRLLVGVRHGGGGLDAPHDQARLEPNTGPLDSRKAVHGATARLCPRVGNTGGKQQSLIGKVREHDNLS